MSAPLEDKGVTAYGIANEIYKLIEMLMYGPVGDRVISDINPWRVK